MSYFVLVVVAVVDVVVVVLVVGVLGFVCCLLAPCRAQAGPANCSDCLVVQIRCCLFVFCLRSVLPRQLVLPPQRIDNIETLTNDTQKQTRQQCMMDKFVPR